MNIIKINNNQLIKLIGLSVLQNFKEKVRMNPRITQGTTYSEKLP